MYTNDLFPIKFVTHREQLKYQQEYIKSALGKSISGKEKDKKSISGHNYRNEPYRFQISPIIEPDPGVNISLVYSSPESGSIFEVWSVERA